MPSFSRTRTAASTARIRAMTLLPLCLDDQSMTGLLLFFNFSKIFFHLLEESRRSLFRNRFFFFGFQDFGFCQKNFSFQKGKSARIARMNGMEKRQRGRPRSFNA